MKALILAGGRGTRLRPLTHTLNKHLLPIGNRPMIYRVIEDAIELGIKDIIINVNVGDTELPSIINKENKLNWKVRIKYIEQPEPNGMMYPIKLAQDLIGNDEFFFSAGDNILLGGLKQYYKEFKQKKSDAHILVVKRKDYQQFGVGVLKNGLLVKTVEKPKKFISDLVLTAIYFFNPKVFEAFDHVKPIDPNNTGKPEYYPPVVNNWLIKNGGKFTASEVTGWWKDTGKPQDLIDANQLVLDHELSTSIQGKIDSKSNLQGRILIGKGVKIESSSLRGPISIKKGSVIKNSYIGPYTSISENCLIENSLVENSILLNDAVISSYPKNIDSSIIGANAFVSSELIENSNSKSSKLYIGDNSSVMY